MADDQPGATETLLIAVAASPDERVRLADLVDGIAPLLLVSGIDELRRIIAPAAQRRVPARRSKSSQSLQPSQSYDAQPAPVPPPAPAAGVLTIDAARSVARCRDREVGLTRLELGLLTCLNTEPLRAWTFAELHRTVWRSAGRTDTADVQSLVKRLRRKLARLGTSVTVDAVRGTGFRLSDHQHPTVRA